MRILFKLFFFFSLGAVTTSCTKDLVPIDYSEINPAMFPKTEEDLQAMVYACYAPLRGSYNHGIFNTSEKGVMLISDATTEILQGKAGPYYVASSHNWLPTSTEITRFYDVFYNKISRMTMTISMIEESSVSEQAKKRAIAEVRCARGILAYQLFDFYGALVIAPLEILKNPLIEEPLARLSHEETVNFIEADLQHAAADLPSAADAEYGRFNKALAKMVLIRLNLHEKRWGKVLDLSNEIIDENQFTLDKNYVGIWDLEGGKKSKEVIWAIPSSYEEGISDNQWQLMVLPSNFTPKGGWGLMQSTWWFYDTFESADIRKTMLIAEYTGSDGVVYNRNNPGAVMDNGPIPLKINPDHDRTTGVSTVDIVMYRYADVLLSKAEALANIAKSGTQEAMDLITIIRNRAGLKAKPLVDYTNLDDFNSLILTERSHEFWCENGQYRADLIRHGKFVERARIVKNSGYTRDYKALFPFSLNRISEGKGKFIQNPGYN